MHFAKDRLSVKDTDIQVTMDDFVIPTAVFDFPKMDVVPAGYYYSEILDVQPRVTSKGKKCIDVVYDLQGFHKKLGDHTIRLSYPEGSQALQDLYKAMLKAGIPAGNNMSAAVGVTERIHLVYDDEDGIGRIRKRVYDPPQEAEEDEDCEGVSEGEEEQD